jgi:hypothetical protein
MGRPCFSGPFSNAVDGGLLFGYNGKNFTICVNKLEDEPLADYILSCCSTADLSKEHFEARHIVYLCAHYRLDGVEYRDDLGQTLPFDKFYEALKAGKESSTYQLNVSEYAEHFEKFLKQGRDVVHVCLSSGITSGTIRRRPHRGGDAGARNTRTARCMRWIPWALPPATGCSWISWPTSGTRACRRRACRLGRGKQPSREPLVFLHRPDLLRQGRAHIQGGGHIRRGSQHLPDYEHGQSGQAHPADQGQGQERTPCGNAFRA